MEHHWRIEKILSLEAAAAKAAELKAAGKKIVTLNGAFDILHAGHLDMLEESSQQGDVLMVGMNSDRSVRDGKGPSRPFIGERERAAMLAALICVDYIVVVDAAYNKVPQTLIRAVRPQVHANGSEYGAPETWIEWPAMKEVGSAGYTVARRPGLATSDVVAKIKKEKRNGK